MIDRLAALAALSAALLSHVPVIGARIVLAQPAPAKTGTGQAAAKAPPRWTFAISSGRFVPVGDQRDLVAGGAQTTATLTRFLTSTVAMTAAVGWARSRELITVDQQRLDVLTYDVGAELRGAARSLGASVTQRPILGAGLGVRSYDPRGTARDATRGAAAYLAVGTEIGVRRLRARIELRDHVSDAAAPGEQVGMRNDLSVQIGLRLEKR